MYGFVKRNSVSLRIFKFSNNKSIFFIDFFKIEYFATILKYSDQVPIDILRLK